tara:strand:- start:5041 stop:6111 length:1071 start_codon:yes stop_codon:yes gene_type:complete
MFNQLKRASYRLSDSVKENKNFGCTNNNNCIGYQYLKTDKVVLNYHVCYRTFFNLIKNRIQKSENILGIHLRVGDWLTCRKGNIIPSDNYDSFIKKNINTFKNCRKCIIFYGNGSTPNQENQNLSEQYINKIINTITNNLNLPVELSNNTDVDTDFINMINCQYFIVGMGGFSHLIGALSSNNVFWDLAIQYSKNYSNINDKIYFNQSLNFYNNKIIKKNIFNFLHEYNCNNINQIINITNNNLNNWLIDSLHKNYQMSHLNLKLCYLKIIFMHYYGGVFFKNIITDNICINEEIEFINNNNNINIIDKVDYYIIKSHTNLTRQLYKHILNILDNYKINEIDIDLNNIINKYNNVK